MQARRVRHPRRLTVLVSTFLLGAVAVQAQEVAMSFAFEQVAALRRVTDVAIGPDGQSVAHVVSVPRRPGIDEDGPAWAELHVTRPDGTSRPFTHGAVNVSNVRFAPNGDHLLYLAARNGDENATLWALPMNGGESHKVLTHDTSIGSFEISPDGQRVAFLATEKEPESRAKRKEKGFTEEVLGEDQAMTRVWVAELPSLEPTVPTPGATSGKKDDEKKEGDANDTEEDASEKDGPVALAIEGSVARLAWAPDGVSLVIAVAPTPSVDDGYMFTRVRHVDATTGSTLTAFDNPGKLGAHAISPDGRQVAMISAEDFNDPKDGRLMLAPITGGSMRDLLPGLEGHVSHLVWRDAQTLFYVADMGAETEIGTVGTDGARTVIATSGTNKTPVVTQLVVGGGALAFVGQRPDHPPEAFRWQPGAEPKRLSNSNPWLAEVRLAKQEVMTWTARDGKTLEGILIHPLDPTEGPAPLLMMVHGGPEGHVRNGWLTSYSQPGQLAAAAGYAIFFPNYRGSTGRGVAFTKLGQGAAAGPEFEDLIDGIDHLIDTGIADRDRIGVTGGSYGGYATAWCSTRYSDRFKAGVMFNGIANKHSKALTTDIPKEDRAVHTLYDPWTKANFALERSPLAYVEQSRTPLLIMGGAADTRVHPSQSLQLWNALRMLGNAPVRLVRYPGEPHGNRRAASRDDYTRRLMRWMNHFVLDGGTEAPPWELER